MLKTVPRRETQIIDFNVQKVSGGYSAYTEIPGTGIVTAAARTIAELQGNALEAYNAFLFKRNKPVVLSATIILTLA
jgi:hypothetical protein